MDLLSLAAAFGGGVLGTALGGVISFSFVGLFGLLGIAAMMAGGDGWNGFVTFGPAWAPAMGGFAAAVAGAAYAATKGKLEGNGQDILTPVYATGLGDALLVGGVFGVLGQVLVYLLGAVGIAPWTDAVALVVVLSAIIVRFLWGKSGLTGTCPAGESRYAAVGQNMLMKIAIGVGCGLFSAALVINFPDTGGAMAFCISAVSLIFLQTGFGVPVTHHYTLPAAVVAGLSGSLVWGAIFGLLGTFVGDWAGCFFNSYGDTHIDPPAVTITLLTTLAIVLDKVGLLFGLP